MVLSQRGRSLATVLELPFLLHASHKGLNWAVSAELGKIRPIFLNYLDRYVSKQVGKVPREGTFIHFSGGLIPPSLALFFFIPAYRWASSFQEGPELILSSSLC